jgi:Icc-related predicted phosphoesterase
MKILHTTDLHFTKHWFEWISDQQQSYDVFCITGDFLEDNKIVIDEKYIHSIIIFANKYVTWNFKGDNNKAVIGKIDTALEYINKIKLE